MMQSAREPQPRPYNEIAEITPTLAAAWLDKNENNRPVNWSYVAQLARDMRAGHFACTHQGIAFDAQGRLIDGQHRLWAVMEADVPVRIRVFHNEPTANIVHIDGNHPRRAADRMTLGRSLGTVRTDELATLRAMLGGISMAGRRRSVQEEILLLEKHREAVRFAHEHLPMTRPAGIANGMTRAVVARAWYCTTDDILLRRFCEVLRHGVAGGDREGVIVRLRDQLIGLRSQRATETGRQRQYALTSRALVAYIEGQPLMILRPAPTELFLLPDGAESPA